jgi:hypothetical protein
MNVGLTKYATSHRCRIALNLFEDVCFSYFSILIASRSWSTCVGLLSVLVSMVVEGWFFLVVGAEKY